MIWGTTILRNFHTHTHIYISYICMLLFLYTSFGKPATHYSEEKIAKACSVYLKVKKPTGVRLRYFSPHHPYNSLHMVSAYKILQFE